MKRIIRDRKIVEDNWSIHTPENAMAFVLPEGEARLILPLAIYARLQQAAWPAGPAQRPGLLLGPDDEPEEALPFLEKLPVLAIHFPAFTDGRGYSTGRLLRTRYGFAGELRAVGDVLRDQLYFLNQCGFNAFDLRPDQDLEEALGAFDDYTWRAGNASPESPKGENGVRVEKPLLAEMPRQTCRF